MAIDPLNAFVVISTLIDQVGRGMVQISDKIKSSRYATISEAKRILQDTLDRLAQQNQSRAEAVANAIMNLNFVQRTPALKDAIEATARKLTKQQQVLRDELSEINLKAVEADNKLDEAYDSFILGHKKRVDNAADSAKKTADELRRKYEQKI